MSRKRWLKLVNRAGIEMAGYQKEEIPSNLSSNSSTPMTVTW